MIFNVVTLFFRVHKLIYAIANQRQYFFSYSFRTYGRETVRLIFDDSSIKCKLLEDSVTILSMINSVKMVDPCTETVVLITKEVTAFPSYLC